MKETRSILVRLLEWGTIVSASGLIITVILQIVTRKFFAEIAPSWTEEASRIFFIYAISFGAGLAQREGYYVSMDYFYRKLNRQAKNILELIISLVSLILFLLMTVFSVSFIKLGMTETSPGLGYHMSVAFVSMLILSGSVLYYLLIQCIHNIKDFGK